VIGYAVLSLSKFDAQILNLCVDKEFRCLGYAENLLNFLISEVRELKIKEMFLEVRPSNSEAVSLYLKKGFEKIGSRKNYYRSEDGREDADIYLLNIKKIGYIS
jgi:ribosomal-protein-alanine N-acetyltransferase